LKTIFDYFTNVRLKLQINALFKKILFSGHIKKNHSYKVNNFQMYIWKIERTKYYFK
jgi:hypothetical protein